MKPLKLTLQAFGPFATKEEIDFTRLGVSPLFLINGATGSGKSSILDAICYALYGETTGSERTGDQMRCDFAQSHLLTKVVFEFELSGKQYMIERSPDQEVPKQRGEGTTKRSHSASLVEVLHDSTQLLANKPKQVATEIQILVGLDVKQFRQVMVLPQGKFRELLTASSKERELIFGQLFQTHIYTSLERSLYEKAASIRKAKDEFDNQIKGALEVTQLDSEEDLARAVENIKPEIKAAEIHKKKCAQELELVRRQEQSAQQLKKQYQELKVTNSLHLEHQQKKPAFDAQRKQLILARKANEMKPLLSLRNQLSTELKELDARLATGTGKIADAKIQKQKAEADYQKALTDSGQLESLNKEKYVLDVSKGKLLELDKAKRQVERQEHELATARTAISACQKDLQLTSEKLLQSQQQYQLQEKQTQTLNEKQLLCEKLKVKLQGFEKYTQLSIEMQKLKANEAQLQPRLKQENAVVETQQRSVTELEFLWHSGQAAMLAKNLEKDTACPVCGGTKHPAPAVFDGQEVTNEQLKVAKEELAQCIQLRDKTQKDLSELTLHLDNFRTRADDLLSQLELSQAPDSEDILQSRNTVLQLEKEIKEILAIDLGWFKSMVDQLSAKEVVQKQNLDGLTQQQVKIENTLAQLSATASQIEKDNQTGFTTVSEVEQRIEMIVQKTVSIERHLEQNQQAKTQALESLAKLLAHFETLQQQRNEQCDKVNQQEELWLARLAASEFDDENQMIMCFCDDQEIDRIEHHIQSFDAEKIQLEEKLKWLQESLSDKPEPDLDSINDKVTVANQVYQSASEALSAKQSHFDNLNKVATRIAQLHSKNRELDEQYRVVGTLSDVANGKTGSKISLHRFVLGVLLDDVLIQASHRLRLMSKGRYDLRRKEVRSKGNASSGLDLIVEDAYSGKWRDVATLSGGESFMAALALALGLSDVVQSYSGGIHLDTLFIDEGFGSLDPESLDLAIQTLIELQQSGRTIGIISHVSELKEQMPQRIDVLSSRMGSSVRLVS